VQFFFAKTIFRFLFISAAACYLLKQRTASQERTHTHTHRDRELHFLLWSDLRKGIFESDSDRDKEQTERESTKVFGWTCLDVHRTIVEVNFSPGRSSKEPIVLLATILSKTMYSNRSFSFKNNLFFSFLGCACVGG
jgi:hypothetical protein